MSSQAPADAVTVPLVLLMATCTQICREGTALLPSHVPFSFTSPNKHSVSGSPTVSADIRNPLDPPAQVGLDSSHHKTAFLLTDGVPNCFY